MDILNLEEDKLVYREIICEGKKAHFAIAGNGRTDEFFE